MPGAQPGANQSDVRVYTPVPVDEELRRAIRNPFTVAINLSTPRSPGTSILSKAPDVTIAETLD